MKLPEPFQLTFNAGEYALLMFRRADGKIEVMIYQEKGRKLKHGKRRVPVAIATFSETE